jgi:hypothetical protein
VALWPTTLKSMAMRAHGAALPMLPGDTVERHRLIRRARLLAWFGIGWHGIEAAIAVAAGLVAGSIALIGFGADSLVESFAGLVLLWRLATSRASSEGAE